MMFARHAAARLLPGAAAAAGLYAVSSLSPQPAATEGSADTEVVAVSTPTIKVTVSGPAKVTVNGQGADPTAGEAEAEEEEVEECGFCRYMKAGPCREVFIIWEKCVKDAKSEDGEDAFFEKCALPTLDLKQCVDDNPDYYGFLDEVEAENKAKQAAAEAAAEEAMALVEAEALLDGVANGSIEFEGPTDEERALLGAPAGAPLGAPLGMPSSEAAAAAVEQVVVVEESAEAVEPEVEVEVVEAAPALDLEGLVASYNEAEESRLAAAVSKKKAAGEKYVYQFEIGGRPKLVKTL